MHADGEPRHFESTSIRVSLRGERYSLATIRDVTGRKKAEALLKRLLDRQRQTVDLVSHEARNPLAAIKGYIDLLQTGSLGPVAEGQRDVLARIADNTDRLTRLLVTFLELERIEARAQNPVRERFPLATLVDTVLQDYRPRIAEKGLGLVVDVANDLVGQGDPGELREALDIVVSNAYHFSSTGTITVRARHRNGAIRVEISDEGRGIPEDQLPRIFDRFYQVASPDEESGHGVGLGLALAKAILESHGGEILVTSKVKQGSTFTLVLPT
jgi:signal transduction histidine kinase